MSRLDDTGNPNQLWALNKAAMAHAIQAMQEQIRREEQSTPERLYEKLRPFLEVKMATFSPRKTFYRCDQSGGALSTIKWGGNVEEALRPNFREFCEWYDLNPREGMS